MNEVELNLVGLPGNTHNYGGLSYGNTASMKNRTNTSNPKEAALQVVNHMKALHDLGVKQAVLPPHERPNIPVLNRLGYKGSDKDIARKAFEDSPNLYVACCSAAAMWTANCATITSDGEDEKVHITPANLATNFHRSIEAPITSKILQAIFNNEEFFTHHAPLPFNSATADEGGANHTRFFKGDTPGVHLFVYGQHGFKPNAVLPQRYPARQTSEASQAIARSHRLNNAHVIYAQQNPQAIDAGAFHNDVVSVGYGDLFFYHQKAFVATDSVIREIQNRFSKLCFAELIPIEVKESEVTLDEAVQTYLFNSQIVQGKDGKIYLIAPQECREHPKVEAAIQRIIQDKSNPISAVQYVNLHQSMWNGGGPACLRLRVPLNPSAYKAVHKGVLFTDDLYKKLLVWIDKHYRTKLDFGDLTDPKLIAENRASLDELTKLLGIGNLYQFQK